MQRAADHPQGIVWLSFLVGLALLAVTITLGLQHEPAGEALPPPPSALR